MNRLFGDPGRGFDAPSPGSAVARQRRRHGGVVNLPGTQRH